ncbi:FecR family protein [Butyricimonas paravirosa]|uniref:FecR family protein n=1 Tax=Butyricimonas paravirosa TaxID=1472417 RepID=UPI00210A509C|nr:FecR domain-containing protein [Butyricimonas paravirosa]MCQ4875522.1 FecR domain-containing protein [Butyricimonas paravirosa]
MSADYEKIKGIIVKSVLGNLTGEENRELEVWLEESDRNKALYKKLSSSVRLRNKFDQYESVDVAKAFRANQWRMYRNASSRLIKKILPYAAVVFMLFGIIAYWYVSREKEVRREIPVALSAGGKQAELILADGKKIGLHEGMEIKLREKSSDIRVENNVISYDNKGEKVAVVQYNTIRTPLGGEYSLALADGTRVWLNAMSELRYPVAFGGGLREVELKGEAYFEVTKDEQKPFIVKTDEFNVRVLGTSFNVSAYSDDSLLHTTLCSGHVRLCDRKNPEKKVDLLPGKQVVFHRESRKMEVCHVDTDVFVSWRDGTFQFDNNTVEEVFTILQRWYNVRVFYVRPEARSEVFTGKLPRFDDMRIIIDLIERVSDLKIEVQGNVIYIDK